MKRSLLPALFLVPAAVLAASHPDLADRVNPIIGTTGPAGVVNYGGVCPWVTPPHGMTDWTPMTQENEISKLPYRHEQRTLVGFMGSHQPTVWMSDYGFITLMPETGAAKIRLKDRGLPMRPGSEISKPFYYSVQLGAPAAAPIHAEMTASARCGIFRLTYPASAPARLLIEMSRVAGYQGWLKVSPDHREIVGYNPDRQNLFRGKPMGPPLKNFKGYFVIQFDRPFASVATWSDVAAPGPSSPAPTVQENGTEIRGVRVGALVTFPAADVRPLKVRIGSSFISLAQARDNLRREIPDWSFAGVMQRNHRAWNQALDRVEIAGGTPDQQTIFYTAMYHSLLYPRRFDEYGRYYSAFDDRVHHGVSYNDYSMWDTFRALHPLLTLIAPEQVGPMIQSMVQMYEQGGWIPKWPNPSYTNIMIGTPADAIIADAYVKGFRNFDVKQAYAAIRKDGMTPPDGDTHKRWADRAAWTSYEARAGLTYYKQLGYVPVDHTNESVSCTLEYALEDYCIAQVAKGLGKDADAAYFLRRAQNYHNVFNPATGFMAARLSDGTFLPGNASRYHAFTEGTAWTYEFCVMQDIPGLIRLMGRDAFIAKLDQNFADGHYAYDNEPENHYPYLYDWVNQPQKTDRILTDVVEKNYRNTPDGISGNDDCGQMSAWYIFTTLGFYPVTPASGEYAIGRPFFRKATLHLTFPKVKTFTILAHHLSPENQYVKSVRLDGRPLPGLFLSQADIENGHVLEFDMTAHPGR